MAKINTQLLDSIQHDVDMLARNPSDEDLRTSILDRQVDLTAQQLEISRTQSADLVRSFTAAKAYGAGYDERELLNAMRKDQQLILNWSNNPQTTPFGIDLMTANKISFVFSAGSGIFLVVAIAFFTVAMFTVGPEIAVAYAGGTGLVATLGAIFGSRVLAIGGFSFLISQILGHFANQIPMATNQMIDNGSIAPGLRLGAYKDIQATIAAYKGNQSPGPFSKADFITYAAALERKGITGIKNPVSRQSQLYSRDALADVILYIYGDAATRGTKLTETKIFPLITPYLILPSGVQAPTSLSGAAAAGATSAGSTSAGSASAAAPDVSRVKIFTGPLTSGTLGAGSEFYTRQDDMIQSSDELRVAAQNNLAAYWSSLPGKISYQIELKPSIKTRDGFLQRAQVVKVVSSRTLLGTPRYKNVYFKFAVMTLRLSLPDGRTTKIAEINLGPVNPIDFDVTPDALAALAQAVRTDTFTSDVAQIAHIVTTQPVVVSSEPPTAAPAPISAVSPTPLPSPKDRFGNPLPKEGDVFRAIEDNMRSTLYRVEKGQLNSIGQPQGIANTAFTMNGITYQAGQVTPAFGPQAVPTWWTPGFTGTFWSVVQAGDIYDRQNGSGSYDRLPQYNIADLQEHIRLNGSLSVATATPKFSAGQTATTLSEFYAANGQQLPSIEVRSKLYEQAALGAAVTYIGTAEQNAKLLAFLKRN